MLGKTQKILVLASMFLSIGSLLVAFGYRSPESSSDAGYGGAIETAPLSAAELQALLAPIALYPDALVAQILAAATFPDQVAVYKRPPNVHPTDNSEKEFERHRREMEEDEVKLGRGECVGIPYSILVPKDWENLWVAGRCHSSETKVHGSIRAQSAAFMMGQAAGTAAVQSIQTGQPACDLDTWTLVETLRCEGAYLPQNKLSREMTRG